MHRVLVIRSKPEHDDRFVVTADSWDASISEGSPETIPNIGGTEWEERHGIPGYNAPATTYPASGQIEGLSYWYVNSSDSVLVYDFAEAGISERKIITSGELHVEYQGRRFVARTGDSMLYLTDPDDVDANGSVKPFVVSFLAERSCSVVYTDFRVI